MIVADSGVKHALGTSEYAKRQSQCAMGLAVLKGAHPSVRALRDVTLPMLEPWEGRMPEEVVRRLRHAITENDRVGLAREALQGADAGAMARILYASHESLAKDYEVSCPELDILVDVASSISGVIGARLTGAGFGGNTINLVEKDRAEACRDAIQEGYASRTGRRTRALIVTASEGLSVGPI
jgi:galactokinase